MSAMLQNQLFTSNSSNMFSFQKLKALYAAYRREKSIALKEEKERLKEERMQQRNPWRPWRKFNENEATAYAMEALEPYVEMDAKICKHFDELIKHYREYEKEHNAVVDRIELDENEMIILDMFQTIHEEFIKNSIREIGICSKGEN